MLAVVLDGVMLRPNCVEDRGRQQRPELEQRCLVGAIGWVDSESVDVRDRSPVETNVKPTPGARMELPRRENFVAGVESMVLGFNGAASIRAGNGRGVDDLLV